jgi:hypothetical protein
MKLQGSQAFGFLLNRLKLIEANRPHCVELSDPELSSLGREQ